ncbi:MAG: hypothetical protein JSS07_06305 [Proteobacteria bacterium]|nr:hypothetical protein [Pseudomonadota bacterium]
MSKKLPPKIPEKQVNYKSTPELKPAKLLKEKKHERRADFEKEKEREATNIIKRKL